MSVSENSYSNFNLRLCHPLEVLVFLIQNKLSCVRHFPACWYLHVDDDHFAL